MAIYKPGFEREGPPSAKEMADMGALIGEMMQKGVLITTDGLQHSKKGARVSVQNGTFTVTDGPFTETKELVAGFAIIEVPSKAEAIEWTAVSDRRRTRRRRNPFDAGRTRDAAGPGLRPAATHKENGDAIHGAGDSKGYEREARDGPRRQGGRGNDEIQRVAAGRASCWRSTACPPSMGARRFEAANQGSDGPFAKPRKCWAATDDQVKSKKKHSSGLRAPMSDNEIIEVRRVQEMADYPPDVRRAARPASRKLRAV
jgi:hypothetical protein